MRDDVPLETIAAFLSFLANGFAFERIAGATIPDLDQLMELVEAGVAPR